MADHEPEPGRDSVSPSDYSLQGDDLRAFITHGVNSVVSLVESTYGPRGMDKVVQREEKGDVELVVTNSGTRVLDAIERGDGFNHPVSAILVDAVDTMHRDLADGSTAALLLTRALLERGYELLDDGLSPSDVVVGYAMASERTGAVLDRLTRSVEPTDVELLEQVASTALGERIGADRRDRYASMIVEALSGVATASDGGWIDTEDVKVVSGTGARTALHQGVVVSRWPRGAETSERSLVDFDWGLDFPDPVTDVRVAILDRKIDVEETAANFGEGGWSGVQLADMEAVQEYQSGFEARKDRIARDVRDLGVDLLVSQPKMDDDFRRRFEDADVAVLDGVETPEADVDRLATASGATVVSRPDELTEERVGVIGRVCEERMNDEKWTYLTDCEGPAYTIVLRTRTDDDAEYHRRLVEDALEVVATAIVDEQVIPGAGAAQMTIAAELREYATGIGGKEQLAVAEFAGALEDTVRVLARNVGADPIDVVAGLRNARTTGGESVGFDATTGEAVDAWEAGIVEPRRVLSQAIETGRTTASRFLTTDAFLYPNVVLEEFSPNTEHN
ncbi:MAG TPA: TCP-1/cpn60 chaperonin family protein [Halobacteriales archaeon]|nr:TCP-1/cpn60 chaperonin family protein [Halobacteriales archaeon]